FLMKPPQGLADRRPRSADPLGEHGLGENRAGWQLAAEDAVPEVPVGLVPELASHCGFGRSVHQPAPPWTIRPDRVLARHGPVGRTTTGRLGVELWRELRDVRLRTETPDRTELVRIDIDAGLRLSVHGVDERLDRDAPLGPRQVDAAGHLLSGEDQLLRLERAAVADGRDLARHAGQLLGLVGARNHLVAARHDDVEIRMRAQDVRRCGESRRGQIVAGCRRHDLDVGVRLDDRVQPSLAGNLEWQGRQPGQPEHLAWILALARLDDTAPEQLSVRVEAEPGEDDLTRDLDVDLSD